MKHACYKNYLLIVLMVILASNNVDGQALGLFLQDIKSDLLLSDGQLGLLTGIAFALFYSVMGIPIAQWADRGNRVLIISLTAATWSIFVAACGLAATFSQLLLIRIGVAVGEAGCVPPAHSLIADYFKRSERPRAVAIYMLGVSLSVFVGYFVAGWLNQYYGWRVTFMLLGLPGLGLAVLAWLTLKEPRFTPTTAKATRELSIFPPSDSQAAALSSVQPTLKEVCVFLWSNTTFRHMLLCYSVLTFFAVGIMQWQPAFFIRSYGLKTGELGTWFALIYGLGGMGGTYLGGELAYRYAADNERLQLKAMGVVCCGFAIISASIYVSPNHYLSFALMGVGAIGCYTLTGPLFATIQTLVPQRMRAVSIATIYLFSNLIGMGLGPFVVGLLSDVLRPQFGEESLRYALLAMSPGYIWAGWHLLRASRTVSHDVEVLQLDRSWVIPVEDGGTSAPAKTSIA